jgi:hypothetical protein
MNTNPSYRSKADGPAPAAPGKESEPKLVKVEDV